MKKISADFEQRLKLDFLDISPPLDRSPLLCAMVGIPAAGKSTFLALRKDSGSLPPEHYYHDPDLIMENIPEYREVLRSCGPEKASCEWELVSREFADNILFPEAVGKKLDIVMDMGMCRPEILEMVSLCRSGGYRVLLNIIYCDLHEAISRSFSRERHVSSDLIRTRAQFLAENLDTILGLSHEAHAFDNSSRTQDFVPVSLEIVRDRIAMGYGLCSTG